MNDLSTGNARLLKLADFLDTLNPVAFDMLTWFGEAATNGYSIPSPSKIEEIFGSYDMDDLMPTLPTAEHMRECGYAACAVGWACAMPEFRAEGLRMVQERMYGAAMPEFEGVRNHPAVQRFFGIDSDQMDTLFFADSYAGEEGAVMDEQDDEGNANVLSMPPSLVAKRIREFVASRAIS